MDGIIVALTMTVAGCIFAVVAARFMFADDKIWSRAAIVMFAIMGLLGLFCMTVSSYDFVGKARPQSRLDVGKIYKVEKKLTIDGNQYVVLGGEKTDRKHGHNFYRLDRVLPTDTKCFHLIRSNGKTVPRSIQCAD